MQTSRRWVRRVTWACVCLVSAQASAFDAIHVVAASGSPVPGLPAGQFALFASFSAPRLGANGHFAYRGVASGTDHWSGVYLFDAEGAFVNRLLDRDRSAAGTSVPVATAISAAGSATIVR